MNKGDVVSLYQLASAVGLPEPDFVIAEVLGGGMGTCLRVEQGRSGHSYAVKIIRADLLGSDTTWIRFIEEIKLWFTLSESTGVVEAICLARLNEIPCMCSPWMQGGTLRERIMANVLTSESAMNCLHRVLYTLGWVQKQHGAIHRDLKPENILFDAHSLACVSDWGLAKLCGDQIRQATADQSTPVPHSPTLTQAGSFLGTVLYASPEQILGEWDIDHRADIYSMGCIMYEMEAGRPPFGGRTIAEIAGHHLRSRPPRLGGILHQTTLGLGSVVGRCLEKRPEDRYQSYDELLEEITRVAQRKRIPLSAAIPAVRARRPHLGLGEYRKVFLSRMLKGGARVGVVEREDLEPYEAEFDALVALGRWKEAKDIIEALYIPELASPSQPWHSGHNAAVNYSLCLTKCGQAADAVKVLAPLATMADSPATYYVNYSLALIHVAAHAEAESLCVSGLQRYPRDKDLLGNYVLALQFQNKLSEALLYLEELLAHGRDVHFLETAAAIVNQLAEKAGDKDWITCIKYRKRALVLLLEARQQNPRFLSARYSLAQTFYDLEQFKHASDEYWEVAKMYGTKTFVGDLAIGRIARTLLEMGGVDECIEFSKKWMSEITDVGELTRSMSMALTEKYVWRDGQPIVIRQALDFFQDVVGTEKAYPEDFCYLAELYGRMKHYDEAEELLKEARRRFPKSWLVPYYNGLVLHQSGNNQAALDVLEEAGRLAPYSSEPDWKMAQIHDVLGNKQLAEHHAMQSRTKKAQRKAIACEGLALD